MTKKKAPTQLKEAVAEAISAEQAKAMLESDKTQRATKFNEKLQGLMAEYRCELVASVTLQGGQVQSNILIVAKD